MEFLCENRTVPDFPIVLDLENLCRSFHLATCNNSYVLASSDESTLAVLISNFTELSGGNAPCRFDNCSRTESSRGNREKTGFPLRAVTMAFYTLTFVFGIFGNSLVLFVIFKNAKIRSRSVSNYYIWNLALADELFVLTLPFLCFATYANDWIFGSLTCKLAYVFRECNKFASVFTLMALSVDRFLATFHTMGRFRQIRIGMAVCAGIWIFCLVLCTPYAYFGNAVPSQTGSSCKIDWPKKQNLWYRKTWAYVQLVVGVVLPFSVIAIFNVLLLTRIRRRSTPGADVCQSGRHLQRASAHAVSLERDRLNSSMTRVVLVIVLMFAICQIPYHIYEFVSIRIIEQVERKILPDPATMTSLFYCNMVVQMLVFISSCCNPIIYGIFNRNYRELFFHI